MLFAPCLLNHPTPAIDQPLIIRTGRLSDLDDLVRIESTSFRGDRLSRRSFQRFLSQGSGRLLVAESADGRVAGYLMLLVRRSSRRARIYSVAVDPAWRGKGAGTLLLGAALASARELHKEVISLEVRSDNTSARDLYLRQGFELVGTKSGYYEDGCDALLLQRVLRQHPVGQPSPRSRVPLVVVDDLADLPQEPSVGRISTSPMGCANAS
ncbi:MAG: N-acetyltransferase [Bacteroidetes bacterium]|nr:N-acetyltransferase [Bacteroidota bacterium]